MYLHYDTKLAYNQHMKFLLAAINAKFIHSNPAVYSLRACVGEELQSYVELAEFTINEAGAGDIGRASEDPATDRDLAGRTGSHL